MASINVNVLRDDLPFGARISGVAWNTIEDADVRRQINQVFEERGMIVFEDMEPSSEMQVALSTVFGPLKEHPVKTVARVDAKMMPGVIEIRPNPEKSAIVEVDGKTLMSWQPWHFDHCYNNELNRAGILRSVVTPPEGGLTAFADGIELYNAISPALRDRIEGKHVIYTLDLLYAHMRFGIPKNFREVQPPADTGILEIARSLPRAIHPAVWTRRTGEKVFHISPWMAVGIEGQETPEGDELLEEVCQEILAKIHPYYHAWKPTDMIIWDNWRMLHEAMGVEIKYPRTVHRTTIKGDYGLGYWENHVSGPATQVREMM
jgi:taurine dioxygenase